MASVTTDLPDAAALHTHVIRHREVVQAVAMSPFSVILIVIVPGLLLLAYGLIKTRKPMSREGLWAGFLAGILVAMALIAWEMAIAWVLPLHRLPPLAGAAAQAVLVAAIPEEGAKFCTLLLVIRRYVYHGDVSDTILAALGIALGFAVMEDAAYVIRASSVSTIGGGVVGLLRSVTAVPEHVVFGLTMGALVAASGGGGHADSPGSPWRLVLALVVPVAMHGAYDFLLMARAHDPAAVWTIRLLPLVMAVSVISAILLCGHVLKRAAWIDRTASSGPAAPGLLGCFLLLLGLLMVGLMLIVPSLPAQQTLAVYCVVPLLFGLDLVWAAYSRI
jgi:RsiW-degrading membrane proteinase PrsW (M82 family)